MASFISHSSISEFFTYLRTLNVYDSVTSLSEEDLPLWSFHRYFREAISLAPNFYRSSTCLHSAYGQNSLNSFITFTILYFLCFFFHDRKMFIQERCTQKVQYFILISPIKQNMKNRRKESKNGRRENNPFLPIKFDIYDGKR